MQTAMHIGVVVLVIMAERIDHRARLLRRRRVIEIDQRMPVHLLVEDREILANRLPIDGIAGDLVHHVICDATGDTPLYLRGCSLVPMLRSRLREGTLQARRVESVGVKMRS